MTKATPCLWRLRGRERVADGATFEEAQAQVRGAERLYNPHAGSRRKR